MAFSKLVVKSGGLDYRRRLWQVAALKLKYNIRICGMGWLTISDETK